MKEKKDFKTKIVGEAVCANRENKGITLIVLVITIIVMLIIVAVTISMAINGGLFNYSENAVGNTKNEIKAEQKLADGRMKINGKWYASIDDYLQGKVLVELPEGIRVGDYVNYTPDIGTYKVASGEKGTGYKVEQSFTTEIGENALKWRILSIDENTGQIELIAQMVGNKLILQGATGYNHGVDILNDLCDKLYSKTVNGRKVAIGRSINVEDINAKTTYDYKKYESSYKYGAVKALSDYGISTRKYPNIYKRETGYIQGDIAQTGLNGSEGLKDGVTDENGVTTYETVTGYTNDYNSTSTDVTKITYTYYSYILEDYLNTNLGINTATLELLKAGTKYWLASRLVSMDSKSAYFHLRCIEVNNGSVSFGNLFPSGGNPLATNCAVRPVVSLESNVKFTKDTKNSTASITYWDIQF